MNKAGYWFGCCLLGWGLTAVAETGASTSGTAGAAPCIDVTGAPCAATTTTGSADTTTSSATTTTGPATVGSTSSTATGSTSSTAGAGTVPGTSPSTTPSTAPSTIPGSAPTTGSSTPSLPATIPAATPAPTATPSLTTAPPSGPSTTIVTPPAAPSSTTEENATAAQPLPTVTSKPQRGLQLLSESLPQRPTTTSTSEDNNDIIYSEILLVSDSLKSAEAHRRLLQSYGLRIKQRKPLKALDMVLSRFRVPPEQDPRQLMQQLREQLPDLAVEFNRRYYLLGGPSSNAKQYGRQHTGLTQHNGEGVTLAMLDAKVETKHPALNHAHIEHYDVTGKDTPASQHGTAVASLLVGKQFVQGALPQARLIAVNIFYPGADERLQTQSHWWLEGLNQVMSSTPKPHAINMSFGGSYSSVIAGVLNQLSAQNVRLVAAAGNSGADSEVFFPASHPKVVAVTAVDSHNKRYRQAPRSLSKPAVAAPGVDIWAADKGSKGFYATGTSFAAPWVTALLALNNQQGNSLEQTLSLSKDLGSSGFDSDFGMGLIYNP